ncbi:phosphotransferase family protein [Flindersiella endophytica]
MPAPLERFEQAPERPPGKVIRQLGDDPAASWERSKVGYDGHFPNGGIWRFEPGLVVKRLGAQFLGRNKVWRGSLGPGHPHWWVREAEFYRSELATDGWGPQAAAARCYGVTDGLAETIEVWLEAVEVASEQRDTYEKALASLANWQLATTKASAGWLSRDWIPTHLRRHGLVNAKTQAHPNWELAIERGLDPRVREAVSNRVTDPPEARKALAEFPPVLTHYDFHHCNIGRTPDGGVRVIDWAYVGWGPVGHDAGHLALDSWHQVGSTPRTNWDELTGTYVDAIREAGWTGPADELRRSIATSTAIRHGWQIDELLNAATKAPDEVWATGVQQVEFVAELIERLPRN